MPFGKFSHRASKRTADTRPRNEFFDILRQDGYKNLRDSALISQKCCIFARRNVIRCKFMTTRREKSKPQKPQLNKQLEEPPKPQVNHRQEKFADFLIDVAKYVFTGVIITSLFNDVTDKTMLYTTGMFIVVTALSLGLRLTNKRKDKEYGSLFRSVNFGRSMPDFPHLHLHSER